MSRPDHDDFDDFDDFDDGECWNCGGEGRVAGTCIDGCCLEQDDPDCPYCSHRCEVCNPPKKRSGALVGQPANREERS
jgi:hypothetical protein